MSGRGRGRGRGRGAPMSQSKLLLKRSAMEAGLDEQHAVMDLTRPRLYPDFIWHSSGDPRQLLPSAQNQNNPDDATDGGGTNKKASSAADLQVTKRSPATRNIVSKQREFLERFAASRHYVKIHQTVDIARYSARKQNNNIHHNHANNRPMAPDELVLESMGPKLANDERYVPLELGPLRLAASSKKSSIGAAKSKNARASSRSTTTLEAWEKRERTGRLKSEDEKAKQNPGEEGEEEEGEELSNASEDPLEEEGDDYVQDHYASEGDESDAGGGDEEAVF